MYESLKRTAHRLFPRTWLLRLERGLRRIWSWGYRGRRYRCNVCHTGLSRFIRLENGEWLCPACGSLPRQRLLWSLSEPRMRTGLRVLHFSPARPLYRRLRKRPGIHYLASDFTGEFPGEAQFDLTAIDLPAASVDLIFCFHILEHIPDDTQAIRELYRVLAPGGEALFQTPFRVGKTYENPSVVTPAERIKHFGQADHVRVYSAKGLAERLQAAGFETEVRTFTGSPDHLQGLPKEQTVLLAMKMKPAH